MNCYRTIWIPTVDIDSAFETGIVTKIESDDETFVDDYNAAVKKINESTTTAADDKPFEVEKASKFT